MPLYEYRCEECGHETEEIQKFSDPVLTECKECGKNSLVKKTSLPSFSLKGGGWYKDGYGTGAKPAEAGKTDAGTAAPAAEAKSDAKEPAKASGDKAEKAPAKPAKEPAKTEPKKSKAGPGVSAA